MITKTLIKLEADAGMILTDGINFSHTVLLREDEEPNKWVEITLEDYKKIHANITPREFILALLAKGVTKEQLENLINSNVQVWAELNYATVINRANPLLDELCGLFNLTPADIDEIFNL